MRKRRLIPLALGAVATAVALLVSLAVSPAAAATARFSKPVALPQSADFGEPSLAVDPTGLIYVTAPQKLGNVTGTGSPVWVSTNGGRSFGAAVNPDGDPISGGDTDIITDSAGNVYQTDLWLGNTAMAVSTDHGQSFIANEWGHLQAGDDRPWFGYSPSDQSMYLAWDGLDGIHVARADLGTPAGAYGALTFPQDVIAVPECAVNADPCATPPIRQCVCPPGGIAVDPNTGEVFVSYSRQNGGSLGGGVGIAYSTDQGLTWTESNVPGTGSTGSAFDTEWNFDPIHVDSLGNVYVTWGEMNPGGVSIKLATSKDHGVTWSRPFTVSTNTGTNVFPAMDVVKPGVVDVSYYGTPTSGDPNHVNATWSLYFAQVSNALAAPRTTPVVAVPSIHTGCIQAGGTADCPDRSLLDFFQLVVSGGKAKIIYTAGDAANGTQLYFVKQT